MLSYFPGYKNITLHYIKILIYALYNKTKDKSRQVRAKHFYIYSKTITKVSNILNNIFYLFSCSF